MQVVFTYRSGRQRKMSLVHARILQQLGHGTFGGAAERPAPTRIPGIKVVLDRSTETVETPQPAEVEVPDEVVDAQPAEAESGPEGDGLDGMGAEALRALAAERGVKVHHKAGEEKLRAALREAAQ